MAAAQINYSEVAKANVAAMMEQFNLSAAWPIVEETDGVTVRHREAKPEVFVGHMVMNAPVAVVMELVLEETDKKKAYDPAFDKMENVEEFGPDVKVSHLCFCAPLFVSDRDFCALLSKHKTADGTAVLCAASTTHDKCPPTSNHVRATLHPGGWLLAPVAGDASKTSVTYMCSSELNGNIPAAINKRLLLKQATSLSVLRTVLVKRVEELAKLPEEQAKIDAEYARLPLQ